MTQLHASIANIPMPDRMRRLPLTEKGFPVLFFADEVDGKPDLRVMDGRKLVLCIEKKLCWLCGGPLGVHRAFVLGPMCIISRTTSEPPSHYDCANYATRACPFLTRPKVHRREAELPAEAKVSGIMIPRNPGVAAIWITRSYHVWHPRPGETLMTVGEPERVEWWAEGRTATRAEVEESIETGLPKLVEQCDLDKDPHAARAALEKQIMGAAQFIPEQ